MELRHLRYAVAVADTLNFTRAAERLHIAQPPLTQQIRALENEIGLTLFDRTNRKVSLTAAGAVFVEHARRILRDVEGMTAASQRVHRGEEGRLVIGFLSSIAFDYFPRVMRTFRTRYPAAQVELLEMKHLPLLNALRSGTVDLAFIRKFFDDPAIRVQQVLLERFVAILPAGHPLSKHRTIDPSRLAEESFVTVMKRGAPSVYAHTISICRKAGFEPNVVQEANDIQACVGLVSGGIGVSIVPDSIRKLAIPGVTYCELLGLTDQMEIVAATRSDDSSGVLQRFLEVALETSRATAVDHVPVRPAALHMSQRRSTRSP
jgi:DNA-binding transcriptional LysR family regulator